MVPRRREAVRGTRGKKISMTITGNVLVAGGAGYIGSHVVHALLDAGRTPVVVDDLSTGRRNLVPDSVSFLKADIADVPRVQAFIRDHSCVSAIHLAGSINVEESIRDPLKYYRNNTCASRAFIESCRNAGVEHFIFSSSAAVYGEPDSAPVNETAKTSPISPYGWSKLMTERMLQDICDAGVLRAVSLRYFNVAGADPQGRSGMTVENSTNLIKALCEAALGVRPSFSIFGDDYDTSDGTCIRDFIHVSDLARIHLAALDYLIAGHPSEIVNCGYGHGYSVRQVVDAVEAALGKSMNVQVGPRREGDIVTMVADITKMAGLFDWSPRHDDLAGIVASSLAWERRLQGGGGL